MKKVAILSSLLVFLFGCGTFHQLSSKVDRMTSKQAVEETCLHIRTLEIPLREAEDGSRWVTFVVSPDEFCDQSEVTLMINCSENLPIVQEDCVKVWKTFDGAGRPQYAIQAVSREQIDKMQQTLGGVGMIALASP